MSSSESYEFNNIIRHIIKKSLFTERQIQIILRKKQRAGAGLGISRGAYYRQLSQARSKLEGIYYTISLLEGLGVLETRDIDVMSNLARQVASLKDSDVFAEREQDITDVIDRVVKQACKL